MQDLFFAVQRNLENFNLAFGNNEKAVGRITFCKDGLAAGKTLFGYYGGYGLYLSR